MANYITFDFSISVFKLYDSDGNKKSINKILGSKFIFKFKQLSRSIKFTDSNSIEDAVIQCTSNNVKSCKVDTNCMVGIQINFDDDDKNKFYLKIYNYDLVPKVDTSVLLA